MVLRPLGLALGGILLAAAAAGCAGSRELTVPRPTSPSLHDASPAPALSAQIDRARRLGPGWLDYCPTRPGRAPARYDLIAPGGGTIPGWCRTSAIRRRLGDYVTFNAHWDARRVRGGMGTATFTYYVARGASPQATPIPLLVQQSGTLPP